MLTLQHAYPRPQEVMKGMNLGPGLVDPRVVGMVLDAMDLDHNGRVSYHEFLSQLRFGQLPFKVYSSKLRHRAQGNPELPFGPTQLK